MSLEMLDSQSEQSGINLIKVIGVGGAGGNVLNNMIQKTIPGDVQFIAANTDAQALNNSLADIKIRLGKSGLGAGARPEVGAQAANEAREQIADALKGCDMLFITAGMGGGTGTGAAPIVAEVAQELGILTVAIVTKPFSFEGTKRMKVAQAGINQLKNRVHSLIVILNDRLEQTLGEEATMKECFEKADEVLYNAASGVAEIIHTAGLVNLDFNDVRTIMSQRGTALIGVGEAEGQDRAINAASEAISCPLLEGGELKGAKGLLINIIAAESLGIGETRMATETVRNLADPDAEVLYGTVVDENMGDRVRVVVIATGIDQAGTDNTYVRERSSGEGAFTTESSLWNSTGSAPKSVERDILTNPNQQEAKKAIQPSQPAFASEVLTPVTHTLFETKEEPKPQAAAPQAPAARVEPTPAPKVSAFDQPAAKAEKPAEPSVAKREQESNEANLFSQAFSRPISQPEQEMPFVQNTDDTIFAPQKRAQTEDIFVSLNTQQGDSSGLWTTEIKEVEVAEKPAEPKPEHKEKAHFDYEIPAFLRKRE